MWKPCPVSWKPSHVANPVLSPKCFEPRFESRLMWKPCPVRAHFQCLLDGDLSLICHPGSRVSGHPSFGERALRLCGGHLFRVHCPRGDPFAGEQGADSAIPQLVRNLAISFRRITRGPRGSLSQRGGFEGEILTHAGPVSKLPSSTRRNARLKTSRIRKFSTAHSGTVCGVFPRAK